MSPSLESGQAVTALTHQEAGDPRGWVRGGRVAPTLLSAFQMLPPDVLPGEPGPGHSDRPLMGALADGPS